MTAISQFVAELKRRKVFRVAALYAAVAWGMIEVADTVFPRLELPDWTVTLVIVLVLLGFPLAVILAWAFDVTPDGVQRAAGPPEERAGAERATASQRRPRADRIAVVGAVVVLALAGGAWWVSHEENAPAVEEDAVAVLPFRTAAASPELHYLREGMLDLLATKLTGEDGPRATDPRSTMSFWRRRVQSETEDLPREEAVALARELGAGQLLLGSVMGTPDRLTLSAEVVTVPDGLLRARAAVDGPADSIPLLVDQLAGELLAREAGQAEDRIAMLADISLVALRAYLAGEAALRRGRWQEAAEHLERALQSDSTFAVAALALHSAFGWTADGIAPIGEKRARALRLAWLGRDRLSERDRLRLEAIAGPEYPEPPTPAVEIAAREEAVSATPDSPELWYLLGDSYYHLGALVGFTDWQERSRAAFARAIALDSAYAAPVRHLVELALLDRDTASVQRLTALYLSQDSIGETAGLLHWYRTLTLADSAGQAEMRAGFEKAEPGLLWTIAGMAGFLGSGLVDADTAAAVLYRRAGSTAERVRALGLRAVIAFNRGRPGEATHSLSEVEELTEDRYGRSLQHLLAGVFRDIDPDSADAAATELLRSLDATQTGALPLQQRGRLAWVVLWKLLREDPTTAGTVLRRLRAMPTEEDAPPAYTQALLVLETGIDAYAGGPAAEAHRARLDSIAHGPAYFGANLLSAWLHERAGDPERALAAIRRNEGGAWLARAALLREEGRLAALTGDTAAAIDAYRRYLTLREHPEPSIRPQVERVRRELARLVGEPHG